MSPNLWKWDISFLWGPKDELTGRKPVAKRGEDRGRVPMGFGALIRPFPVE